MSTPSSGTICWSQIQSVSGGSYCMSNFNAVSGRGYCASNYYSYSPPSVCYEYYAYDYGLVTLTDCNGLTYNDYFFPGAYFCAQSASGPVFQTGFCSV